MDTKKRPVNENWRYSSVTLPKDFLNFLDEIIIEVSKKEGSSVGSKGVTIPSRRAIVQDAVEMYISELYPTMYDEYTQMLKDCGMHQPTIALRSWMLSNKMKGPNVRENNGTPEVA